MIKEVRKMIDMIKNFGQPEKYKSISPRTLMEGIELNGFSINRKNDNTAETIYFDDKNELTEDISYEFKDKGGIIVFSINVNAIKLSKNNLISIIKNKIETLKNRFLKDKKIDRVISKYEEIYGITVGNFVNGRYKAENGSLYDEKSLSIEIIGIRTDVLNKVAEDLAKEFKQETVLVKNYQTNGIYLVK